MVIEQIEEKITNLSVHINSINTWIKNNPQVIEPNIYEIMDCNITYAELIAELLAYYNENGWVSAAEEKEDATEEKELPRITKVVEILHLHPALARCSLDLHQMETLQGFSLDSFISQKEEKEMYAAIKMGQLSGTYTLPESEEDRRIKKELICKSMSIPFYICQVQKTEPGYQYDNQAEYDSIKDMFYLYEAKETPCQYKSQISNLFAKIEQDYKYGTPKTAVSACQK